MKSIRELIGDVVIRLGVAGEFCEGDEAAVKVALGRVHDARRQLADIEARLQTILRTGR